MHEVVVNLGKNLSTYRRNIKKITKLLENGYLDESVVLLVTIFEVFLRDTVKSCRSVWFYHEPHFSIGRLNFDNIVEYRQKIRDYLESIGAYDEFLKNYYEYQNSLPDPEMDSVYATLFETKRKRGFINFQNLTDARQALKALLDIDLKDNLDDDRNRSNANWSKLNELVADRHRIIHQSITTDFSNSDVQIIIESLDYCIYKILSRILEYYQSDFAYLERFSPRSD